MGGGPVEYRISKDKNEVTKNADYDYMVVSAQVVSQEVTENLSIEYGIESYYVPEGNAGKLEQNSAKVWVEAAVDKSGDSAISQIFLDGRPIEFQ